MRKYIESLKKFEVFFENGEYYFEFVDWSVQSAREEILEMKDYDYDYTEWVVNNELKEGDFKFDEIVEVLSIDDTIEKIKGVYDVTYKVKLMFENITKHILVYNYDEDEAEEIENTKNNEIYLDNLMTDVINTDLNGINTFNESYFVDKKHKQVLITVYYEEN